MAELLGANGYRTALYTDTYHQFKPSKNFHRGFDEWCWIRGQEGDPYRSGPLVSDEEINKHAPDCPRFAARRPHHRQYLTNVAERRDEEDYFAAQVFRGAANWLWRNQDADRFFLVLDSFDPHEPWDPPVYYRRMYDPDDDVVDVIWSTYRVADEFTPRELQRMRGNYAGECTMVDRWLGHFLDALRLSGRLEDTIVALISDHGHNLGDANLTGKQGHPLTRAVADLIMMIRHPQGEAAGARCDALCYNFDLTATLMNMLGEGIPEQMAASAGDVLATLGDRRIIDNQIAAAAGNVLLDLLTDVLPVGAADRLVIHRSLGEKALEATGGSAGHGARHLADGFAPTQTDT